MRAWHAIGADDLPVMSAQELADFVDAESQRALASLAEETHYAEHMAKMAKQIGDIFGVSAELPEMPPIPPVPTIEEVRATIAGLTAEFWTEHRETAKASAWVTEHHPSGAFVGVPFDMLPDQVKHRATVIAVEALYDREIARRIVRQLPPLPDLETISGSAVHNGLN